MILKEKWSNIELPKSIRPIYTGIRLLHFGDIKSWIFAFSSVIILCFIYQCKTEKASPSINSPIAFQAEINGNSILRVLSDSILIREYITGQAKTLGFNLESMQTKFIGSTLVFNCTISGKNIITEMMVVSSGTHSSNIFIKHNTSNENQALALTNSLKQILDKYKTVESIYKYKIEVTNLYDSTILTKVIRLETFPDLKYVKKEIGKMEHFIHSHKCHLTNSPMVNIEKATDHFTLKIGLPIDKDLQNTNGYEIKRMLPKGKFLTIQNLKTSFRMVNTSFEQLTNYIDDYGYNTPAIPFISMVDYKNLDDSLHTYNVYYPIF
jgi:hypothetical protein